jgi:hypothetical protein
MALKTKAPVVSHVTNINAYLLEGGDVVVCTRTKPINGAKPIQYGSMMIDKPKTAKNDVGLLLLESHRKAILDECPEMKPFIKRIKGGDEFLYDTERFCLWLEGAPPELVRSSKLVMRRLDGVRAFREGSKRPQTRKLAATPGLFGERRQPTERYLLIPKVSSEGRDYVPIGFEKPSIIASGSALTISGADLYDFGILSSSMHNSWIRAVAGRMKSDYQYSNKIAYNNFPWPKIEGESRKLAVEAAAQDVLEERAKHLKPVGQSTLADLYDPNAMPRGLSEAHRKLDWAVEQCYRKEPFDGDLDKARYLLQMYEQLVLAATPKKLKAKPNGKAKKSR